jgi:putative ABC transport system permease protein
MTDVALQMLYGDRSKYSLLISGIAFSVVLMAQGLAMLIGIISFSTATLDNVRAPIWVVMPTVEQVEDIQPMKDTDVDRVRSVAGVAWAAPLSMGSAQGRVTSTGVSKSVTVVAVDSATLAGLPRRVLFGNLLDIRKANAVIIDEVTAENFGSSEEPLGLGDVFEMNDKRAEVVAIVRVKEGQGGAGTVFTTLDRARVYVPNQRKMVTQVLAGPQPGLSASEVAARIAAETQLQAVTEEKFGELSRQWMVDNTPIPLVFGIIVAFGFLVGVVVCGQTFYNFVLENTRNLGALKAMGATSWRLTQMTVLQALVVGITGYGIGMGALGLLFLSIPEGKAPLVMNLQVAGSVLGAVLLIIAIASLLGIRRLAGIEPASVFRS